MDFSRRDALIASAVGACSMAAPAARAFPGAGASLPRSPFTLGVASGDPNPDGVVLWTRLALSPLDASGRGGMPNRPVDLQWEVASDAQMSTVIQRGTTQARPEDAHAVHVEVHGLLPGREYWYRFRAAPHLSPIARTHTAPAAHEMPAALTLAIASCAQYEHGWFTAYRRLAQDRPDLVLHLGDYQYEYRQGTHPPAGGSVRDDSGPETVNLAGYRRRHAQYKADPDLQAAHAVAPWLVVFDDHEVDNNWASDVPENQRAAESNDSRQRFRLRRAAAFQAYYENMPLRRSSLAWGPDMKIFRRIGWGRLANFHMLDTRQYRHDQACGDGWRQGCAKRLDPTRSITGAPQERWLLEGLNASQARWDLLGQQVFFAQRDRAADPALTEFSMDGWDGYAASRERITRGWMKAGVRNPVVLTGDVHTHWANDLRVNYADPHAPIVGSELVCTSVTSGGDGLPRGTTPETAFNPHVRYFANQRGYVRTTVRAGSLRADFRVLDTVARKGSPVRTDASWELVDGQRGLRQVTPSR